MGFMSTMFERMGKAITFFEKNGVMNMQVDRKIMKSIEKLLDFYIDQGGLEKNEIMNIPIKEYNTKRDKLTGYVKIFLQ